MGGAQLPVDASAIPQMAIHCEGSSLMWCVTWTARTSATRMQMTAARKMRLTPIFLLRGSWRFHVSQIGRAMTEITSQRRQEMGIVLRMLVRVSVVYPKYVVKT